MKGETNWHVRFRGDFVSGSSVFCRGAGCDTTRASVVTGHSPTTLHKYRTGRVISNFVHKSLVLKNQNIRIELIE